MMRLLVSGISMVLRTTLTSLAGFVLSLGWMLRTTVVPSSPLMRLMLVSMATLLVDLPSTLRIRSPGTRPAAFAGDPSNTEVMTRPSSVFCREAPMPEYEPRSFSSNSCTSLGVRYTV